MVEKYLIELIVFMYTNNMHLPSHYLEDPTFSDLLNLNETSDTVNIIF